eukprot:5852925-Pyramimonas_sp.AAC.1
MHESGQVNDIKWLAGLTSSRSGGGGGGGEGEERGGRGGGAKANLAPPCVGAANAARKPPWIASLR